MEITTMWQALQVHAQIIKSPNSNNDLSKVFTFSALSPAGDLSHARLILDSLHAPSSFHLNTMLRAYALGPDPRAALRLFLSAAQSADKFSLPPLLKSCSRLRAHAPGRQLHALALKSGLASDRYVAHALIHMYSKSGHSRLARQVFDKMPQRDVVSWTAMIAGLSDDGRPAEAVATFDEMLRHGGVEPNEATAVSVLKACAETGALSAGERVHHAAGVPPSRRVATALIDMYAKCGSLEKAKRVFEAGPEEEKDRFAWTAMISGLASHGRAREALAHFERMIGLGVGPDAATMTAVLSACSGADEARVYVETMTERFKVRPVIQHYSRVVDLYARAGQLDKAEAYVAAMPLHPDRALWRSLVWGSRAHGDTRRAERLMRRLEDHADAGSLVLIGNVYASSGKWAHKARARRRISDLGLTKPAGTSRVEVAGRVHEFVAGGSAHPEAGLVYHKLAEVAERAKDEGGYMPVTSEALLEEDGDGNKASQLSRHSEKLALAYGLAKSEPGSTVRIVKNLRSCVDCHEFMKAVSAVYGREIVVRDRVRFHRFARGKCSCNDSW